MVESIPTSKTSDQARLLACNYCDTTWDSIPIVQPFTLEQESMMITRRDKHHLKCDGFMKASLQLREEDKV